MTNETVSVLAANATAVTFIADHNLWLRRLDIVCPCRDHQCNDPVRVNINTNGQIIATADWADALGVDQISVRAEPHNGGIRTSLQVNVLRDELDWTVLCILPTSEQLPEFPAGPMTPDEARTAVEAVFDRYEAEGQANR